MRPLILLNADVSGEWSRIRLNYAAAVRAAGGNPLVMPAGGDPGEYAGCIDEAIAKAQGLLLTGGNDYDPARWGEKPHPRTKLVDPRREAFDAAFAEKALASGLPCLGVCGGAQLLCIAAGGRLLQHLAPDDSPSPHSDGARHGCRLAPGSALAAALSAVNLEINSYHHQAVHPDFPGKGFRIVARALPPVFSPLSGGGEKREMPFFEAVEGIEAESGAPVIGVQWHPERMLGEAGGLPLFGWLVETAREGRRH